MKKITFLISLLCLTLASFAQQFSGNNNINDPIWRNGPIGIGTTAPTQKLQISGGNVLLDYVNGGTIGNLFFGGITHNQTNGMRHFFHNVSPLRNGYIDVRTDAPTNGLVFRVDNAYADAERMRICANGNIGIGTSNPLTKLEIVGDVKCTSGGGYLYSSSYDGAIELASGNDGQSYIDFKGNLNLNADYAGRILHRDGAGFFLNSNAANVLNVNGRIRAKEVKVELAGVWADYVFASDYKLRPLEEVEAFVKENNHLPNIPSACEVETNGIEVAAMLGKQMEKIEELTLYLIELKKENEALKTRISKLENR